MENIPIPELEWFSEWEKGQVSRPDVSSLKSIPDLPSLLEFYDGRRVSSPGDWENRRKEITSLLCEFMLGTFPDENPVIERTEILHERREANTVSRKVKLGFATCNNAEITLEIMHPDGKGPFPVFFTQTNHRAWGLIALSRGYLVCIYPACDIDDQSSVFKHAYPSSTWSLIPRRAWTASRALDYVSAIAEADTERVAITGHSRNGKQALIAAAFDCRFKAVISSSSGSGGACPYRFVSETAFEESVEFTTRMCPDWFNPRLRYFTGQEDRMPIDCHGLLGLIAPRHCLLSNALNDGCESSFALERSYEAALRVYNFMDRKDCISIRYRHGEHETSAEDIHSYIDYCDRAFGMGKNTAGKTISRLIHRFDWDNWRSRQEESALVPPEIRENNENRRERILWGLGAFPSESSEPGNFYYGAEKMHVSIMMRREENLPPEVTRTPLNFGEYIAGNIYHLRTPETGRKSPAVIWLHPYSYPTGYTGAYMNGPRIYNILAKSGFVVMAYDQVGFGTRIEEGANFYERYPGWSRLGKMVSDVKAAVDFLLSKEKTDVPIHGNHETIPEIDERNIYCAGYSLGGMVALYAAALDARISGLSSFCGFTPLRTDTAKKNTGGIERLWKWHALQPRLGMYMDNESSIPYDFDDVLALIAPRPMQIVSPAYDRESDIKDITRCIENARKEWHKTGNGNMLHHVTPEDYNRFQPPQHGLLTDWLAKTVKKSGPPIRECPAGSGT